MMTSCAPTPFMRSCTPKPLRSRFPSMRSAGNLFGTTRTSQPRWFGPLPLWRTAMISGGVLLSFPSQNGQKPGGSRVVLGGEIVRTTSPFGSDDHPAFGYRIVT